MLSVEQRLTGGHPNSLGNTEEVVDDILSGKVELEELYQCYFSTDEVVRLRVSSAMKRVCKAKKERVVPYIDRLLNEIALIDQASTQWTLAQLFLLLQNEMNAKQMASAKVHLKDNLQNHSDWIVLNTTMEALLHWAREDDELTRWLRPQLERLAQDPRKSVAKRATKYIAAIDNG